MDKVLEMQSNNPPMIFCPLTNFKRSVTACMVRCKEKDINWCGQIKRVPIEVLGKIADEHLSGTNLETWNDRIDFFTTPAVGNRKQEDPYNMDEHGGGGVKLAEDLEETEIMDEAETVISGDKEEEELPEEEEEFVPSEQDLGDLEDLEKEGGEEVDADAGETENQEDQTEDDSIMAKKCPECGEKFESDRGLKIHIGRAHKKDKPEKPKADTGSEAPAKPTKKPRKARKSSTSGNGTWIVMAEESSTLVESADDLAKVLKDMDTDDNGLRIFEIAREVKIETQVNIVDI